MQQKKQTRAVINKIEKIVANIFQLSLFKNTELLTLTYGAIVA